MPSKLPEGKVDQLALAVARGSSLASAARSLDVPLRTAQRWAGDPTFPARVVLIRREILSESIGVMTFLTVKAAEKLDGLLDSADEEIRLKAVRAVYADFLSVHTYSDLAARLDALEAPPDGLLGSFDALGAQNFA